MELLRNSCRGVHSHSNGEKTFSFEGNIMMTLKLDMKHISEWEEKVAAGSGSGVRRDRLRGGGEFRAFLRTGSRCKGRTAPL